MPIRCEAMDDAANFLMSRFDGIFADEPVETASFCVDPKLRALQEVIYTAVRIVHTTDKTTGIRIISRYQAAAPYRRAKPMPQVLSEYQRAVLRRYLWIAKELDMPVIASPNSRALTFRMESSKEYAPVPVPSTVELLFSLDNQPVFRTAERDAA